MPLFPELANKYIAVWIRHLEAISKYPKNIHKHKQVLKLLLLIAHFGFNAATVKIQFEKGITLGRVIYKKNGLACGTKNAFLIPT